MSLSFFFHSPLFFFAINPIVESISTICPLTFGWNVESRSKRKISMLFFLLSSHVSLLCDKKNHNFYGSNDRRIRSILFLFSLSLFIDSPFTRRTRLDFHFVDPKTLIRFESVYAGTPSLPAYIIDSQNGNDHDWSIRRRNRRNRIGLHQTLERIPINLASHARFQPRVERRVIIYARFVDSILSNRF